ncbi:hypothetical protein NBRC116494_22430 [Aurantivibrio plasticivorans]
MRYSPYENEYKTAAMMSEAAKLEYFLTRVFEAEEIWGLDDGCEWVTIDHGDDNIMPIWPYEKFAQDFSDAHNAEKANTQLGITAESLEDFLYNTLSELIDCDITLSIMPDAQSPGCLISPHRLYEILEGMIDAGEYKLDS